MPFAPFHQYFAEVAEHETRSITVPPGSRLGVPAGDYGFVEMFCDEPGCDCRRVMFSVLSSARQDVEAVIAWGWEDRTFYARWLKMDDPHFLKALQGPILNPGSPQTRYAGAVLQMAKDLLLTDPAYVERVKRHYAMFRARIDRQGGGKGREPAARRPQGPKGGAGTLKRLSRRARRRYRPDKEGA
jgi:hypothetical protein